MSMTSTISRIREIVAGVTGLEAVYAPSETDARRVPAALNELPCALVIPGDGEAMLSSGQRRHTYEVRVMIYQAASGDIGSAASLVLPMVDRLIDAFVGNVLLADAGGANPRANSCTLASHTGLINLEYSGSDYMGYIVTLRVSEQAAATPAPG